MKIHPDIIRNGYFVAAKRPQTISIADVTHDSITISWAQIEVATAYSIEFVPTSGGKKVGRVNMPIADE